MGYTLPWGTDKCLEVAIPAGWKVALDHHCQARPPIPDFPAAVRKALAEPDAGPALVDLARKAREAVIVIDDVGRPTPSHLIAPLVREALNAAGLPDDRIKIVFAIGTHRPMTADEMRKKAGPELADRLVMLNHDCRDNNQLANLGVTEFGTPVLVNRAVAEADLRVLIGTIEPHPQAGFGGGLKNLVPGVAGAGTIGRNHLLLPSPERWNMIGTMPEDNPMRRDLESAAGRLTGVNFLLNTVLGPDLRPTALVAGDATLAHRRGVKIARELYGVFLKRPLDAVIVSSYPMDQDLRQGVKGVANAPGAVRKGGAIVCFLRLERGLEDIKLPRRLPPPALLRGLLRLIGSRGIYALANHLPQRVPVERRFIVNFGLQVLKDYHVLIFSPELSRAGQGRLKEYVFEDQTRLFARVERLLKTRSPTAGIIAEGGVSFPIIES